MNIQRIIINIKKGKDKIENYKNTQYYEEIRCHFLYYKNNIFNIIENQKNKRVLSIGDIYDDYIEYLNNNFKNVDIYIKDEKIDYKKYDLIIFFNYNYLIKNGLVKDIKVNEIKNSEVLIIYNNNKSLIDKTDDCGIDSLKENLKINNINYNEFVLFPNKWYTCEIFSTSKNDYLEHEKGQFLYSSTVKEVNFNYNLIDQNILKYNLNDYLIHINNKNNIEYMKINNYRKKEFLLLTYKEKDKYIKKPLFDYSINHLNEIYKINEIMQKDGINTVKLNKKNNKLITNTISGENFEEMLLENINNKKVLNELLDKYKNDIMSKLKIIKYNDIKNNNIFDEYKIKLKDDTKSKLTYIKNGYIDLVPQNIIYKDKKLFVIDQEWLVKNVPIEFILYRFIFILDSKINSNKIKEYLYNYFNIDVLLIPVFEKLNRKIIDERIFDKKYLELEKTNNNFKNQYKIENLIKDNNYYVEENNKIQEINKGLNKINSDLVNTNNILNNANEELNEINKKLIISNKALTEEIKSQNEELLKIKKTKIYRLINKFISK